ncbi:phosphoglycolate phosphatase [Marinobacter sp. X15-166B]|uniref:phosphoglycolate phosphatase n=1 Tax=Marinobacter sp. X15-166B TaxID=1897620 RepID=UPI00085BFA17|nr:phosphoglycolate phosphatase [Marinobacter sp. X15-166B]OEY65023.1 phosphoglycolate phosphatase [Marinobacter sp. X15-166B]
MKHPVSTVLFDLDGTLIDTAPDFIRCLNQMRTDLGMAALPAEQVRRSVSNGARAMVEVGFGLLPGDPDYESRHAQFLDLYEQNLAAETRLFPGIERALEWLEAQAIPWGIVTNKPERFTTPLLAALQLSERCAAVICPDHVEHRKPHPESLLLACKQLGANPADGIYVGDHLRDIEAGRNAGMTTVAVRYGYIENPEDIDLWQADHTVETVSELVKLLQYR